MRRLRIGETEMRLCKREEESWERKREGNKRRVEQSNDLGVKVQVYELWETKQAGERSQGFVVAIDGWVQN